MPVTLTAGGAGLALLRAAQDVADRARQPADTHRSRPRARVTVDGQPFGRTPTVVTGLTPGPHQVVLETDTERVSRTGAD